MRILNITNLYPPHFLGGYEVLCEYTSKYLEKRGHEVFILTSRHGVDEPTSEGRIYRRLKLYQPFDRPAGLQRSKRLTTFRHNHTVTRCLLRQLQPDVVFIWSQLRLTAGGAMAAQEANFPVAMTMNDNHLQSFVPPKWGIKLLQLRRCILDNILYPHITIKNLKFDHVTCISEDLKSNLIDLGVPVQKAKVIYQGIPLHRFPMKDNPGILHKPIHLCYVGQLQEWKGVHLAIPALASLLKKNPDGYWLELIGTGDAGYTDRLVSDIKYNNIEKNVHFRGRVPPDQIGKIYRKHDVFLFTSTWEEPFGLTHLEAMASGTPVISTFRGGMKEFLIHEENCLIFNPDQPGHLAEQVGRIVNDDKLRHKIIYNARQTIEQKFSASHYVDHIEKFLEWTIKNHHISSA